MTNETETVPGVEEWRDVPNPPGELTLGRIVAGEVLATTVVCSYYSPVARDTILKDHAAAVHAPKLAAAVRDWTRGHNARGGDGPCECSVCDALAAYEQAMEVTTDG